MLTQTITEQYAAINFEMHRKNPSYGANGKKCADIVAEIAEHLNISTILDYGCGKQTLKAALPKKYTVFGYDPAFSELRTPMPAELVTCTDVMEHVEREYIDATLKHIFSLADVAAFFVISCERGIKRLPNGSHAHCSVYPKYWWHDRLSIYGYIDELPKIEEADEVVFLVTK